MTQRTTEAADCEACTPGPGRIYFPDREARLRYIARCETERLSAIARRLIGGRLSVRRAEWANIRDNLPKRQVDRIIEIGRQTRGDDRE